MSDDGHIFSCFNYLPSLLLAWGLLVVCTLIKNKSTLQCMGLIAPSSEIWIWHKCLFHCIRLVVVVGAGSNYHIYETCITLGCR